MAQNAFATRILGLSPGVAARTHSTPQQQAIIKNLADIFDRRYISSDPIAQVGALNTPQGDIGFFKRPKTTALGTTYTDNMLPKDFTAVGPVEQRMIAQAGMNIANLKDKVVLGPTVLSGENPETIPHEMTHRGAHVLADEGYRSFWGGQEGVARALSLLRGENDEETMSYLNNPRSEFRRFDKQPWTKESFIKARQELIDEYQRAALRYLQAKGLTDRPQAPGY